MAVSQAFIFHFKCYSILHFAVCQLLCWAFLWYLLSNGAIANFVLYDLDLPFSNVGYLIIIIISETVKASAKMYTAIIYCYLTSNNAIAKVFTPSS